MPRHAFWLIVDGAVPTAFRARQRDDLLPTLHQLRKTQPGVALVWFERGRTWLSPDEARAAALARRKLARERNSEWRPGGSHVDPRARYRLTRDEKRARFRRRQSRSGIAVNPPPGHTGSGAPGRPKASPGRGRSGRSGGPRGKKGPGQSGRSGGPRGRNGGR